MDVKLISKWAAEAGRLSEGYSTKEEAGPWIRSVRTLCLVLLQDGRPRKDLVEVMEPLRATQFTVGLDDLARRIDGGVNADTLGAWRESLGAVAASLGSLAGASAPKPRAQPREDQQAAHARSGRWRKGPSLGAGGQGKTFLAAPADALEGEWRFVIKIPKGKSDKARLRFAREAEFLRRCDHPCIARFVDAEAETESTQPFIVTERVMGRRLDDVVAGRGSYPLLEGIELVLQLAQALEQVHASGIVHRDIKPANIVVADSSRLPVLVDFGLGFDPDMERATSLHEPQGSKFFTAPELADGAADEVSPAADLYNLGKVMYFVLSGGGVFDREAHKKAKHDLEARFAGDGRYRAVNQLLDRLIVEEPTARLGSAAELSTELRRLRARLELGGAPAEEGATCIACGEGRYRGARLQQSVPCSPTANTNADPVTLFLRLLACDSCGRVEAMAAVGDVRRLPESTPRKRAI